MYIDIQKSKGKIVLIVKKNHISYYSTNNTPSLFNYDEKFEIDTNNLNKNFTLNGYKIDFGDARLGIYNEFSSNVNI